MSVNDIFGDYQFYPTPESVLYEMDIPAEGKIVADLSAGKGNILDFVKYRGAKKLVAVEIEPNLQKILLQKGYRLIGDDCLKLTSEDVAHVDLFVLNPPFRHAVKHILHTYQIAREGAEIISLCNAKSIDDTHTISDYKKRKDAYKLGGLIRKHGFYKNLYDCFGIGTDSERKTDAYVNLVKLFKPVVSKDINWDDFYFGTKDSYHNRNKEEGGLIRHDDLIEIVNRVRGGLDNYNKMMSLREGTASLLKPFGIKERDFNYIWAKNTLDFDISDFQVMIYKKAWSQIFSKLRLEKYMTSNVIENINKFTEERSKYPFTVENVYRAIDYIMANSVSMRKNSIISAIDYFKDLAYDDHTETGWKTNKDNILAPRFIVDRVCCWRSSTDKGLKIIEGAQGTKRLEDVMKLIFISKGLNYKKEEHSLFQTVENIQPVSRQLFEWNDIFRIRMYLKGTAHLEFLHEKDWQQINIDYNNALGNPIAKESVEMVWKKRKK